MSAFELRPAATEFNAARPVCCFTEQSEALTSSSKCSRCKGCAVRWCFSLHVTPQLWLLVLEGPCTDSWPQMLLQTNRLNQRGHEHQRLTPAAIRRSMVWPADSVDSLVFCQMICHTKCLPITAMTRSWPQNVGILNITVPNVCCADVPCSKRSHDAKD